MRAVVQLLRFTWDLVVILTPLFGTWLASSLAAYLGGPRWAALAAGAFLFPVGPLLWELWAERRKRKKNPEKTKRLIKRSDRLVLRTLFLNLAFAGALLGIYPAIGFAALSTRGDWFLPQDEAKNAWTQHPRKALFWTANQLEFLYVLARPNAHKQKGDDGPPAPPPDKRGDLEEKKPKPQPPPGPGEPLPPPTDDCPPGKTGCVPSWPLDEKLHPLVATVPKASLSSVRAVGQHLMKEPNPYHRVKAIHDFVANHVRYDMASTRAHGNGQRKPQDSLTVLQTGLGVCEGYARLAVALGGITGDKIVYVTGYTRTPTGDIAGVGHAWNAVEIEGAWYLMDPTWDAGAEMGGAGQWKKRYQSDYLLTPAKVFALSHFPDNDSWQLLAEPISRGEFLRQPILDPGFHAAGLKLVSPTRSQVDARGAVALQIDNPNGNALIVKLGGSKCKESGRGPFTFTCPLPQTGRYAANIFVGPPGARQLWHEGTVSVISR